MQGYGGDADDIYHDGPPESDPAVCCSYFVKVDNPDGRGGTYYVDACGHPRGTVREDENGYPIYYCTFPGEWKIVQDNHWVAQSEADRIEAEKEEVEASYAAAQEEREKRFCEKTSSASPTRPPGSTMSGTEGDPVEYQISSTGYVFVPPPCGGSSKSFISSTLEDALETFFVEYRGMHRNQDGGRQVRFRWWLANQLLKHDVGRSRERVKEPEPEVEEFDAGELEVDDSGKIQGLGFPMEENLLFENEDLDPYEKHIYDSIVGAALGNFQNVVSLRSMKDLARQLSGMQREIKEDPEKALFKMYHCAKAAYFRIPPVKKWNWREWMGDYDPLGEMMQNCYFVGWTLDPVPADRHGNMFF